MAAIAEAQTNKPARAVRALNLVLMVLTGGLYAVFLTGDYFVGWLPVGARLVEAGLAGALAVAVVARLWVSFPLWDIVRARWHWVALVGILLAGLALRARAIDFGLPAVPGDDSAVVEAAWKILRTGDYNPHDLTLPSLYVYVEAATYAVRFIYGVSQGLFSKLESAQAADFYAWGRLVTAMFGLAAIYSVYQLGRRLYGISVGLTSAFLLTFSLLHAQFSRAVQPDVLVGLLLLLSALALSFLVDSGQFGVWPTRALYFCAGLAIGLAGAMRLSALLGLGVLLAFHFLVRPERKGESLVIGLSGVAAGFLTGAPYALLDVPAFVNSLAILFRDRGFDRWLGLPISVPWREAAGYFLRLDFGLLAAGAAGLAIVIARFRSQDLLVALLPPLYFLVVVSTRGDFAQALAPILPFVALLAALAIHRILGKDGLLGRVLARRLGPLAEFAPWAAAAVVLGVVLAH